MRKDEKRHRTSHGQFCLTSVNWNNSSYLCNCRMVQKIRNHIKYSITSRVPTVYEKSPAHYLHMSYVCLPVRMHAHTQTQMCACINQWWPMCVFVDWTIVYMFLFISMFLKPTWQFWCELSLWGMNRCEWYDENDRKKTWIPWTRETLIVDMQRCISKSSCWVVIS